MEQIFQKESDNILDVTNLEDVCQVLLKQEKKQNRKANAAILAFITSYNRIYLHKNILYLLKNGFRVHYCDCDSIFFSGDAEKKMELPISHSFGDFKLEFKDKIESFRAYKRKTFFVHTVLKNDSDLLHKKNYKICGMNLKPYEIRRKFEKVIEKGAGEVPQVRRVYNKTIGKREDRIQYYSWNGETKCQRKVLYKSRFLETVPWGYKFDTE